MISDLIWAREKIQHTGQKSELSTMCWLMLLRADDKDMIRRRSSRACWAARPSRWTNGTSSENTRNWRDVFSTSADPLSSSLLPVKSPLKRRSSTAGYWVIPMHNWWRTAMRWFSAISPDIPSHTASNLRSGFVSRRSVRRLDWEDRDRRRSNVRSRHNRRHSALSCDNRLADRTKQVTNFSRTSDDRRKSVNRRYELESSDSRTARTSLQNLNTVVQSSSCHAEMLLSRTALVLFQCDSTNWTSPTWFTVSAECGKNRLSVPWFRSCRVWSDMDAFPGRMTEDDKLLEYLSCRTLPLSFCFNQLMTSMIVTRARYFILITSLSRTKSYRIKIHYYNPCIWLETHTFRVYPMLSQIHTSSWKS